MSFMSSPLVVTPAAIGTIMGALFFYSSITDDPRFDSVTALRSAILGEAPPVQAKIKVAEGLSPAQEAEFKDLLESAFDAKGVPMQVRLERDPSLTSSSIYFAVGPTKIGPMPLRDAARGVRPAAEAYRMGL